MTGRMMMDDLAGLSFQVDPPHGWKVMVGPEWTCCLPEQGLSEHQGWKVHVSSTLNEAERVLSLVSECAFSSDIVFKFLSSPERFFWRNSKMCAREHAGKFITLYPRLDDLDSLLLRLEELLRDVEGPYVLSDRKWDSAPVFLRFGVFQPAIDAERASVHLIDPQGHEVPDRRSLSFEVPDWAPRTPLLASWLAAQLEQSSGDPLPFEVTSAMKYSNAGGVYCGVYEGDPVILKEARPHAGLDPMLRDAVMRLSNEADALKELSGLQGVPAFHGVETVCGHVFLIQQKILGTSLQKWALGQGVMGSRETPRAVVENYLGDCLILMRSLTALIERIHERGWAHGDVHPGNVLVQDEVQRVSLIDFENAHRRSGRPAQQLMAAPGFGVADACSPEVLDFHGLSQIGMFLLFPSVAEDAVNPDHGRNVIARLRNRGSYLGVGAEGTVLDEYLSVLEELNEKVVELNQRPLGTAEEDRPISDAVELARELELSIRIFSTESEPDEGLGEQFSMAKLLGDEQLPQRMVGTGPDHDPLPTEWTAAPMRHEGEGCGWGAVLSGYSDVDRWENRQGCHPGLPGAAGRVYDGFVGELLMRYCLVEDPFKRAVLDEQVTDIARAYLADPVAVAPVGLTRSTLDNSPAAQDSGLLYGHLGYAWLFSKALAIPVVAQACRVALENELSSYVVDSGTRTLQLCQGRRVLPYLATGSAGFGVVLPAIPIRLWPDGLEELLPLLRSACDPVGSVFPGLLNGYAGLLLGRAGLGELVGEERAYENSLAHLVTSMDWYAVRAPGRGVNFTGDGRNRYCSSLGEGVGGVLLTIECLQRRRTDFLEVLLEWLWTGPRALEMRVVSCS